MDCSHKIVNKRKKGILKDFSRWFKICWISYLTIFYDPFLYQVKSKFYTESLIFSGVDIKFFEDTQGFSFRITNFLFQYHVEELTEKGKNLIQHFFFLRRDV